MYQLNFPEYSFQLKQELQKTLIYDIIRKKFVTLTPEEWVRQHVVHDLIHVGKFSRALISVERQILYNQQKKRFDVVIFNRNAQPHILIECKAPYIKLDEKVCMQSALYSFVMPAQYIYITNGLSHYFFVKTEGDTPGWTMCERPY